MKCRAVAIAIVAIFSTFARSQVADSGSVMKSQTSLQPASPKEGDPVDLETGLYIRSNTDLYLEDSIPIRFTRTYRNADSQSRSFGIGTSDSFDMFIVGDSAAFSYVELILADGARIHYKRISPGQDFASAVFQHTSTATEFYDSQIKWNGNGWTVSLHDGSSYKLGACNGNSKPGQCGVVEFRNNKGEVLHVIRERNGNVRRIASPGGKWVALTYDTGDRIVRADDSVGRSVHYSYDEIGRLMKVQTASGEVFTYKYDAQNRMTGAREGGDRVLNAYNGDRCIHQIWSHEGTPHTFTFKYLTDKSGSVRETDVIGPNHSLRRAKFNANGYTEREVYNEGRPNQINVNYNRDLSTNNLKDITVTCLGMNQTRRLKAPVGPARSGELETQVLISTCAKQSR